MNERWLNIIDECIAKEACEDGVERAREFDTLLEFLKEGGSEDVIWLFVNIEIVYTDEEFLVLSKDSEYAYLYALEVLKGRFELGEEVISRNLIFSNKYKTFLIGLNNG